jgi:hypothetical protein
MESLELKSQIHSYIYIKNVNNYFHDFSMSCISFFFFLKGGGSNPGIHFGGGK